MNSLKANQTPILRAAGLSTSRGARANQEPSVNSGARFGERRVTRR